MEHNRAPYDNFKAIGRDLVIDIMSRLDALSLIAASATCTELRDAAKDETLWKTLCHSTWPSTSISRLSHEILKSPNKVSFKRFLADAFPLVSYDVKRHAPEQHVRVVESNNSSIPRGFASFVDIYYKGHCLFSKALDSSITNETCGDNFYMFRHYPFRLDLLDIITATDLPCDTCGRIDEELRLSWIIYDETKGRAFNVSGWKPRWANVRNEDHTVCFGCIVPIEDEDIISSATDLALAEIVITVKFKSITEAKIVRWKEIEMAVKNIDGMHLNMDRSMRVINRAFSTVSRSLSHCMVEDGYKALADKKMQLKMRADREEILANLISATIAIATLLGIFYACGTLL